MILLENGNRMLAEIVGAQLGVPEGKREGVDIRLCDFDDVTYRIQADPKGEGVENLVQVSMNMPCYSSIKEFGGANALQKYYGDRSDVVVAEEPIEGFDITLNIDVSNTEIKEAELVEQIKLFKTNILGGVFEFFFDALNNGETPEPFKFALRSDTDIYFFPSGDRVVVVFGLNFSDKFDQEIARVFLKQFPAVQRKSASYAPPMAYNAVPPSELKAFNITTNVSSNVGFVSFPILKSHLAKDRSGVPKQAKVVASLQVFRNYLQYHIKCSKSFFHQRMRARVVSLLQVLNRAKVVKESEKKKGKKTMSGKTFARK